MKEQCCKECYCCKACRVGIQNFYKQYMEKARAYTMQKIGEKPYSVFNECNRVAKEVYRDLNPERYRGYMRIYEVISSDAEVDKLYSIYCMFVDTYAAALADGTEQAHD